ncbi:MAG: hypothetical protein L0L04_07420, partial [Staphylococcus equorum]|nr:hypothetical protein [Staphylococcus equorum]
IQYFSKVEKAAKKIKELTYGFGNSADENLENHPKFKMTFKEHYGVTRIINWVRGYAIIRGMELVRGIDSSMEFLEVFKNITLWRKMEFKYSSGKFHKDARVMTNLAKNNESILNQKFQPIQPKIESFGSFYTKNEIKERSEGDVSSINKDVNSGQYKNKNQFKPRPTPESVEAAVGLIKRKFQYKNPLNLKELEYIKNKYKEIEAKIEKNHKDYLQVLYEKRGIESPFTKEANYTNSFKTFLTQNSIHMDQIIEEPYVEVYKDIPIGNQDEYTTRTCDIIENFGLNAMKSTKANIPNNIDKSLTQFNNEGNLQEVNTRNLNELGNLKQCFFTKDNSKMWLMDDGSNISFTTVKEYFVSLTRLSCPVSVKMGDSIYKAFDIGTVHLGTANFSGESLELYYDGVYFVDSESLRPLSIMCSYDLAKLGGIFSITDVNAKSKRVFKVPQTHVGFKVIVKDKLCFINFSDTYYFNKIYDLESINGYEFWLKNSKVIGSSAFYVTNYTTVGNRVTKLVNLHNHSHTPIQIIKKAAHMNPNNYETILDVMFGF